MSGWASHILPSLESLGIWAYWIIGAASMLESFFVTGIVVPGTLIVDAGGALVRLGRIDFFDLVWFVALGAILGGEAGFWLGRIAGRRFQQGWAPTRLPAFRRAEGLFQRHGGMALILGRFLGPVAGLVPLAAALTGMPASRFRLWNIASGIIYAFAHVAIGFAAGDILARIGPVLGRDALVVGAIALLIGFIYLIAAQIRRALPVLMRWFRMILSAVTGHPLAARLMRRHPRLTRLILGRFETDRFSGLILTALIAVLLYLATAWAESVFDFLSVPQVAETDLRLARLIHVFWTPELLRLFGLITQLGHWPVVLAVFLGTAGALAVTRRWPSLLQLCVALGGELVTVRLLKGAFDRPRPELGYFVETSGSFPSGHATLSIAFWGTLVVILWRERLIGVTTALILATAFAVLIGGSRLYLIEHFLSDVLNGWLLGGIWLVVGLGAAEWLRHARGLPAPVERWRQGCAIAIAALGLAAAGYGVATANPPLTARQTQEARPVDPLAEIGTTAFPAVAETLTGDHVLPIRVVITAPDTDRLTTRLATAGWTPVATPTFSGALQAAWDDLRDIRDPGAPVLPMFWNSHPQDLALRNDSSGAVLRLWLAGRRKGDGAQTYAVALEPAETGMPAPLSAEGLGALMPGARNITVPDMPDHGSGPDGAAWLWDGSVLIGDLAP
ncbi:phosphatase PAP2 family protein [Pseudooceanicola sp. 216_PA32_1]|uniref:Phosphatase PAP2 family protein n=1 Tax=Pseudooceanicola pacificus TaxID=2676438 RepID=A0A844W0J9_9RHOB|nr:bifunctional DedA family/phosphatase PAP2 family protein [Pseudooceanicola pacificus]MWB76635.1 phosphatase PAP2 family protein [Pseudooceanicola pacificus]